MGGGGELLHTFMPHSATVHTNVKRVTGVDV